MKHSTALPVVCSPIVRLPLVCLLALAATSCLASSSSDGGGTKGAPDSGAPASTAGDPTKNTLNEDTIQYRELAGHPGCTVDGLEARAVTPYTAAKIPGYQCAAKEYPMGATPEDKSKPIVLLVHGNSSTPADYEKYPADTGTPMLSERLVAAGFHTFAVDMRFDKTDDPTGDNAKGNAAHNIDHGWGVPIVQHFVESMMAAYPGRQFEIVSFSLGPTVVRDALRRSHKKGTHVFERIDGLVYVSGANHGVSSFRALCASNPTMRGRVACEMGDRTAYVMTDFHKPLNGPDGAFETPCLDGDSAYGQTGVCGKHKVKYTTVVMQDISQGTFQDEFVSEASAALKGADNKTVSLADTDPTGYFLKGLFKSHYGPLRSEAGLKIILGALGAGN
ncbi:MAG: hypothetical protein NVS3B10_11230 [Polyangiales bacterium]